MAELILFFPTFPGSGKAEACIIEADYFIADLRFERQPVAYRRLVHGIRIKMNKIIFEISNNSRDLPARLTEECPDLMRPEECAAARRRARRLCTWAAEQRQPVRQPGQSDSPCISWIVSVEIEDDVVFHAEVRGEPLGEVFADQSPVSVFAPSLNWMELPDADFLEYAENAERAPYDLAIDDPNNFHEGATFLWRSPIGYGSRSSYSNAISPRIRMAFCWTSARIHLLSMSRFANS